MIEPLGVGIDCGDRELRVAYTDGVRVATLPLPRAAQEPDVFFDRNANVSGLGVGFPSVLRTVGEYRAFGRPLLGETPASLATRRFRVVRQALVEAAGRPPGETILAAPASLSASHRNALLDCARAADFERVSLIETCQAAALAQYASETRPVTVLVFDLGYGGCEFSLVRLTRGRCWVVASGSAPGVSGEVFDAVLMEGVVLALRKQRIFLGITHWNHEWLAFRQMAEDVRAALEDRPEAAAILSPQLTALDRSLPVHLFREPFARKIAPLVAGAVERVQEVLEHNTLELADIDAFLLIGGVAQAPPVWNMLYHAFGGAPVRTHSHLVAAGAAWQACQQADRAAKAEAPLLPAPDASAPPEPPPTGPDSDGSADGEASVEFARVVDAEAPPASAPPVPAPPLAERGVRAPRPPHDVSLAAVRALIGEGKRAEAEVVLDIVLREAEALKAEMSRMPTPAARRLIQQALALVIAGEYQEAIDVSHQAYDQARDDPIVFEGMMKVHTDVARCLDRPEEYQDAVQMLLCALNHDQTSRTIRKALGDRHYLYAVAMRNRKEAAQALEATREALSYDPSHPGANQLLRELTAGPPQ